MVGNVVGIDDEGDALGSSDGVDVDGISVGIRVGGDVGADKEGNSDGEMDGNEVVGESNGE